VASEAVIRYWQAFRDEVRAERPDLPEEPPDAWQFGDSAELADSLADLVLSGTKTATAGLLWEYEAEGVATPVPGKLEIVLNSRDEPVCVIEYTAAEIVPFDAVTAEFAALEGEGDRTLEWWRHAHWRYFSRRCEVFGKTPAMDMPVVCEQFRVVWVR
jgi:uncharacterized protein YhfF